MPATAFRLPAFTDHPLFCGSARIRITRTSATTASSERTPRAMSSGRSKKASHSSRFCSSGCFITYQATTSPCTAIALSSSTGRGVAPDSRSYGTWPSSARHATTPRTWLDTQPPHHRFPRGLRATGPWMATTCSRNMPAHATGSGLWPEAPWARIRITTRKITSHFISESSEGLHCDPTAFLFLVLLRLFLRVVHPLPRCIRPFLGEIRVSCELGERRLFCMSNAPSLLLRGVWPANAPGGHDSGRGRDRLPISAAGRDGRKPPDGKYSECP